MVSDWSWLGAAGVMVASGAGSVSGEDEWDRLRGQVAANYGAIAHAVYEDSLVEARRLREALGEFVSDPDEAGLERARRVWTEARVPYLQSEVFRFYGGPIDDDDGPEGLINAWPLDESYLDYVKGNPGAGLIADAENFPEITPELLAELNERDGETNIASGYHAIEFLLWGQDLSADGPGSRPASDFSTAAHAERRGEALLAAADLLVRNLEDLVDEWASGKESNYRAEFEAADPDDSLRKILTGMSQLSGFELAGERLTVAYDTQAQEDEHSCFSDTTHRDAIYDAVGIRNVWKGVYERLDETVVRGPAVAHVAETLDAELGREIEASIDRAVVAVKAIPAPFDQAILGADDANGRVAIMTAIETLEAQAALIDKLAEHLGTPLPEDRTDPDG